MHRRDFVSLGISGLVGFSGLARLFADEKNGAGKNMILLWLNGGPATIDMWDMKPKAAEQIRGEFNPINTSVAGIQICEHMPNLAKQMHHCTLIRSLHHTIPAHGPGSQYVLTGNKPSTSVEYPALGSIASKLLPGQQGIPNYISFGGSGGVDSGYLGGAYNSFDVSFARRGSKLLDGISLPDGFAKADLARRTKLQNAFDQELGNADSFARSLAEAKSQSVALLKSDKMRQAFDTKKEDAKTLERYGRSDVGQNALIARRLIEAGARYVTVNMSGWDTHAQNFRDLRNRLLPQLDSALAGLLTDLSERGRLSDTIVCCMGEFGRTPIINGGAGRDHWARAMSAIVAGGGFQSGIVYGATDSAGQAPTDRACTPSDLTSTLAKSLGIPPNQRLTSATGRPMTMFREGSPIDEILQ